MKLTIENIYSEEGHKALVEAYTKSMWAKGVHNKLTWCGVPAIQLSADLLIFAELIWNLRPKLIVECGIFAGGGLIFYSSMLHLLGDGGEVVGIDINTSRALHVKSHQFGDRITLIQRDTRDPNLVSILAPKIKDGNVIFILDSDHQAHHVRQEMELFAPLIPSGSYLIVMDGIMKILHDVPGAEASWIVNNPDTALNEFLPAHPEFVRDLNCNRLGATCGPGGFLKRK